MRLYELSDLLSIESIYKECFKYPLKIERIQDVLESETGISLIAGEKPHVNGVIISWIDESEPWIWGLAVRPEFRERGIGVSLLKEIEKIYVSCGHKKINLFVENDNPTQKLYFDAGYRVVYVNKDIYEAKPALKMSKILG